MRVEINAHRGLSVNALRATLARELNIILAQPSGRGAGPTIAFMGFDRKSVADARGTRFLHGSVPIELLSCGSCVSL